MPEIASTPIFSALASLPGRAGAASSAGGKDSLPGENAQGSFASILKQQFKQPQQTQSARTKSADAAEQAPDPASIATLAGNFLPLQQAEPAGSILPDVGDAANAENTPDAADVADRMLPASTPDETASDAARQARPVATESTQIHGLPAAEDNAPAADLAPDAQGTFAGQNLPAGVPNPASDAASEATGSSRIAHAIEQAARRAIPALAPAVPGNSQASASDGDTLEASWQTAASLPLSQARQQSTLAGANLGSGQNKTATAEFAGAFATANDAAAGRGAGAAASQTNFDQILASAHAQLGQAHPVRDSRIPAEAPARMEAPLGSSAWDRELGDKLVWMVGRQEQRAELVLNPPQLGRVEISLSLRGEQTNATFMTANPAVREALENALPRLREMFADAGLSLGQAQVGADSGSHAASQSFANGGNGDNSSRFSATPDDAADGNMTRLVDDGSWVRQGRGMVDVFA